MKGKMPDSGISPPAPGSFLTATDGSGLTPAAVPVVGLAGRTRLAAGWVCVHGI